MSDPTDTLRRPARNRWGSTPTEPPAPPPTQPAIATTTTANSTTITMLDTIHPSAAAVSAPSSRRGLWGPPPTVTPAPAAEPLLKQETQPLEKPHVIGAVDKLLQRPTVGPVEPTPTSLPTAQSLAAIRSNLPQSELVTYFAGLPGGQQLLAVYHRHLAPYTTERLAKILPPSGFTSISPPIGYVPPTRTEANMVFVSNSNAGLNSGDQNSNMNDNIGFLLSDPLSASSVTLQGLGGDGVVAGSTLEYDMVNNETPPEIAHLSLSRVDYQVFKDLFQNSTQQLINHYNTLIEASPVAKQFYEQQLIAYKSNPANGFNIEKLKDEPTAGAAAASAKAAYRQCLTLLLQIKNGAGRERKSALRKVVRDAGKTYKLIFLLPFVFQYLEHHITHNTMDQLERHILFKLITRLLLIHRQEFIPHLPRLMHITRSLLENSDYYVRSEGGAFIQMLTKILGPSPIIKIIKSDMTSNEDMIRDNTARIFSYISSVVGIKAMLPYLKVLLTIPEIPTDPSVKRIPINVFPIDTGLRIIQKVSSLLKAKLVPYMNEIMQLIIPIIHASQQQSSPLATPKITAAALTAITHLCDACAPYVCPSIDEIAKYLFFLAQKSENKPRALITVIRCITSFLGSLSIEDAISYWNHIDSYVIKCCIIGDSQSLITGVNCLNVAINIDGLISSENIIEHIIPFIINNLLDVRYCMEPRNIASIKALCVTICNKINLHSFVEQLVNFFTHNHTTGASSAQKNDNHFLNIACCKILTAITVDCTEQFQLQVPAGGELENRLVSYLAECIVRDIALGGNNGVNKKDGTPGTVGGSVEADTKKTAVSGPAPSNSQGIYGSTKEPELFGISREHIPAYILNSIDIYGTWTTHPFIDSLTLILTSLGPERGEKHVQTLCKQFQHTLMHMSELRRYHAAIIIARVIPLLSTPSEENKVFIKQVWLDLNERLGEEKPLPLGAILCALHSVINTMYRLDFFMGDEGVLELDHPTPTDCFTKVFPILGNGHELVILCCNRLLTALGTHWGHYTPANEWLRIITQYVTSHLKVTHRVIRKNVVKLVGVIAYSIGSADVVLKLLPHLKGLDIDRTTRVGINSCLGCIAQTCGISMVLPLLYHTYETADFKTSTAILKAITVCIQHCAKEEISVLPQAIYPLLAHTLTSKYSKLINIGMQISSTLLINCTINNYNEVGKSLAEAISAFVHPLRGINYNVNSWWWEYRTSVGALANGYGLGMIRSLYTGMFHCAQRVRETHWVWYNNALHIKGHQLPMHHVKITTPDKLVYNPSVEELEQIKKDNGGELPTNEPVTQYHDPYIFHSLSLPF